MNKCLIIFIWFVICIESSGQPNALINTNNIATIKCTYDVIFQPDSNNTKNILTEKSFLLIGKNASRFQTLNSFALDSIILSADESNPNINLSGLPKTKFTYIIVKEGNKVTTFDNIYTTDYKYYEENLFKWVLKNEKQLIAGYSCQKATTTYAGRAYEAWFTKEIPISDGPYKFFGLPGLIVKINDTKNHYSFELTSLARPKRDIKINFVRDKVTTTTRTNFIKGLKNYQNNAIDFIAHNGPSYGDLETQRRIYKEKIKKRNNPIELK